MLTGLINGMISAMHGPAVRCRPVLAAETPQEPLEPLEAPPTPPEPTPTPEPAQEPPERWAVRVRGKRAARLRSDPDFILAEPLRRGLFRVVMARKVRGAKRHP